jgi:hypothetical protein
MEIIIVVNQGRQRLIPAAADDIFYLYFLHIKCTSIDRGGTCDCCTAYAHTSIIMEVKSTLRYLHTGTLCIVHTIL